MWVIVIPMRFFSWLNDQIHPLCRGLAILSLALVAGVVLIEVVYRHLLDTALGWPADAMRFGMLWVMALVLPVLLRDGGFAAIDLLARLLPEKLAGILNLALSALAIALSIVAMRASWDYVNSGYVFKSAIMRLPAWYLIEAPVRIPEALFYLSLFASVSLMLLTCLELILDRLAHLLGYRPPDEAE